LYTDDEGINAETLMRRTPLLELYSRQLKQQYLHANDRKKVESEQFLESKCQNTQREKSELAEGNCSATSHGNEVPPTVSGSLYDEYYETLGDSVATVVGVHEVVIIEESLHDESQGETEDLAELLGGSSKVASSNSLLHHSTVNVHSYYVEEVVGMGMSGRSFLEEEIVEETENTEEGAAQHESFVYEEVVVESERRGSL
jgi:hypothetical protein